MLTQWMKACSASFLLIVGTLAMFQPAGAEVGLASEEAEQRIA